MKHSRTPTHVTRQNLACRVLVAALLLTASAVHAQIFTTLRSFGIFTDVTGFNPQSTLVQGADGTLYGTAATGEGFVAGTVFKVQPDGTSFTILKCFTNAVEGANPYPGLALSGTALYGTTAYGGTSNCGTVFTINTDGSGYTVLKNFTGSDGAHPYYATLTLGNGTLYGATYYGGSSNAGTVFRLNTDGTGFALLKSFAGAPNDGANPNAALTLSGSVLYGTTENGGRAYNGTLFRINTDGTGYTILRMFTNNPDGAFPDGVVTVTGSTIYGSTYRGGTTGWAGTLYKVNTNGTGYAVLKSFAVDNASCPSGPLALSGGVLYGTCSGSGFFNGAVFKINTNGSGYALLQNFTNSPDAAGPYAGLILSGGALYGTTSYGGAGGTVFRLNTDGTGYAVFSLFRHTPDAATPYAPMTLSGNVLYGTTYYGGDWNYGSVFKVNTDGTGYTILKSFDGTEAAYTWSGLTLSSNVLYGTTAAGGTAGNGTVFALNTDGSGFTLLHSFAATTTNVSGMYTNSDGASPAADLLLSGNTLYGTANVGGSSGYGTVFALNVDGSGFTNLHNFTALSAPYSGTNSDGAFPRGGVVLSGSTLYGAAAFGGALGNGTVFALNTDGTGFSILHNFTAGLGYYPSITNADGAYASTRLLLSGNTLYGTTETGGTAGNGTAFALNTDGSAFTNLHSFAAGTGSFPAITNSDGTYPAPQLILSGNTLFGTALYGGSTGNGTVFALNTDGTGFTTLYRFTGGMDGGSPFGGVLLSGDTFYGTAAFGGFLGNGTVFSLSFPPQLAIAPSGTNVVLSWPVTNSGFSYTGYVLQETLELGGTNGWTTVLDTNPPVIINGQFNITRPMLGPQWSYRLKQQ